MKVIAQSIIPTSSLPYMHMGYLAAATQNAIKSSSSRAMGALVVSVVIIGLGAAVAVKLLHRKAISRTTWMTTGAIIFLALFYLFSRA